MNTDGRVSICGCISQYNLTEKPKGELIVQPANKHCNNNNKYALSCYTNCTIHCSIASRVHNVFEETAQFEIYSVYFSLPTAHPVSGLILTKQLMVRGFIVTRWLPRWPESFKQMGQWIAEVSRQCIYKLEHKILLWIIQGKLKYKEHVVEGFDNMPDAFIGLFRGDNTGKVVVKA